MVLISFVLFFLPEYDPETNEALLYFTDSLRSNAYGTLVEWIFISFNAIFISPKGRTECARGTFRQVVGNALIC